MARKMSGRSSTEFGDGFFHSSSVALTGEGHQLRAPTDLYKNTVFADCRNRSVTDSNSGHVANLPGVQTLLVALSPRLYLFDTAVGSLPGSCGATRRNRRSDRSSLQGRFRLHRGGRLPACRSGSSMGSEATFYDGEKRHGSCASFVMRTDVNKTASSRVFGADA
jgi:hypothetical protein